MLSEGVEPSRLSPLGFESSLSTIPCKTASDACGTRTHVTDLRGQFPNLLEENVKTRLLQTFGNPTPRYAGVLSPSRTELQSPRYGRDGSRTRGFLLMRQAQEPCLLLCYSTNKPMQPLGLEPRTRRLKGVCDAVSPRLRLVEQPVPKDTGQGLARLSLPSTPTRIRT